MKITWLKTSLGYTEEVKMPVASNIFSGAILAPLVAVLSAISLAALQRSFDWVAAIAKNPQKYVTVYVNEIIYSFICLFYLFL